MGWFDNLMQRQFRKMVLKILITNVPDFEKIEGAMPLSTVETAYKTAWHHFGKQCHDKHPSIYRAECAKAAEYVVEFYETAAGLPLQRRQATIRLRQPPVEPNKVNPSSQSASCPTGRLSCPVVKSVRRRKRGV